MIADLTNPEDPVVANALTHRCQMCGAKAEQRCHNIINGDRELPGKRLVHYTRVERWDVP